MICRLAGVHLLKEGGDHGVSAVAHFVGDAVYFFGSFGTDTGAVSQCEADGVDGNADAFGDVFHAGCALFHIMGNTI